MVSGLLPSWPATSNAPAAIGAATPFTIIVPPPGPPKMTTLGTTVIVSPPLTVIVWVPLELVVDVGVAFGLGVGVIGADDEVDIVLEVEVRRGVLIELDSIDGDEGTVPEVEVL